jgi:uncharacterized membrane protein
MLHTVGLYLMAAFFIYAGINHFRTERFFLKMMPPYLPAHKELVLISGVAEIIVGGLLLIPVTRVWGAWSAIALLIAVFPANVFMATSGKFPKIPAWFLWARLPLQGLLIWWAYQYT